MEVHSLVKKYEVSCYSPPSSLKVKSGDMVEVKGWGSAGKVRADTITNATETGSICRCGPVLGIITEKFPKWVEIKGKVGKVIESAEGIEFELDAEE